MFLFRFCSALSLLPLACLALYLTACGGGGASSTPTPVPLTVTLGASSIIVPQDGVAATLPVTITGPSTTFTEVVTGLPTGITEQYPSAVGGPVGSVVFAGTPSAAAGTYTASLTVSMAGQSKTVSFSVISAPVITLGATIDTTLGLNGGISQAMATSFQPDEYDNAFFTTNSAQKITTLGNMAPRYLRIQGILKGVPMVSDTGTAADWDFSTLDAVVQPLLAADGALEFQIAVAPAWMQDANGHLDIANHLSDFTTYAANLVRYYNKGGFDYGGQHFASPSQNTIYTWGIFNEPNGNGISASDYVKLYNAVVPAMLAVDPTLQFSAIEFSDYGLGTGDAGDPELYLPTFLAGVNTQVDIVSTHLYSTCNQNDSDATLLATVPGFAQNVQYFQQQIQKQPGLANTQVWVTENNVNADYSNNGISACNPPQVFVTDKRGTSAFFAAWRPYAFSQLAKAGNRALFHWDYDADQQYGEVDYSTGLPYLSYWVDKTLSFAYIPGATNGIFKATTTDPSEIEVLHTVTSNQDTQVLIVNHAVQNAADNNGSGSPRTVIVDFTNANLYSGPLPVSAGLTILDANTNLTTGPVPTTIPVANRIPVTLNGYATALLGVGP